MLAHEACSVEFLVSQCGHDGLRQNQIRARSRGQLGEPLQQYVLRRARRTKQLTVLGDNIILCKVNPFVFVITLCCSAFQRWAACR